MNSFISRKVKRKFFARDFEQGPGHRRRIIIGGKAVDAFEVFDPFILMEEFSLSPPAGFPDHPSRGLCILTYILPTSKGGLNYENFKGHSEVIEPGGMQCVAAGRGMVDAQMPQGGGEIAQGIQLWINLPAHLHMMEPQINSKRRSELLIARLPFPGNDDATDAKLAMSDDLWQVAPGMVAASEESKGSTMSLKVQTNEAPPNLNLLTGAAAWAQENVWANAGEEIKAEEAEDRRLGGVTARLIMDATFGKDTCRTAAIAHFRCIHFWVQPGATLYQPIPSSMKALVYVLGGEASFGSKEHVYISGPNHLLELEKGGVVGKKGGQQEGLLVHTSVGEDEPCSFLLIYGSPVFTPAEDLAANASQQTSTCPRKSNNKKSTHKHGGYHQAGAFVSQSHQGLQQALAVDFQCGCNGFEGAPGWHSVIAKQK